MNGQDGTMAPAHIEPSLLEFAIPDPIEVWTLMELTDLELTRFDDRDLE